MSGSVDGWSSRAVGGLMLPVMSVAVYLLLRFLPKIDPRVRKSAAPGHFLAVLGVVRISMTALLAFMFAVQMAAALRVPVDSGRLMANGFLIVFLVLGNFFGSLRPNYLVGIRTPWTLKSEATWRATHRVGGRIMVVGSILLLGLQFVLSNITGALVCFILGLSVWSFLYSWIYYRAHRDGPKRELGESG